jgi:ABC-type antimicrobial peptide transport system permease subunit
MIRHNLRIILASALKNPRVALINIIGLSLGLACALLMYLWVRDELSFDKFYKNAGHIYLAYLKGTSGNNISYQSTTSPVISKRLKDECPEVRESARLFSLGETTVKYGDKIINETSGAAADQSIFSIFDFRFVSGSSENVFEDPSSIILTESMAHRYFGNEDPIGKDLLINNKLNFTVRGIIHDFQKNAYLRFDFVIPFSVLPRLDVPIEGSDFYPCAFYNYVMLNEKTNYLALNERIGKNITMENNSIKFEIELIPVTKTYLQDSGGAGRLIIFSIISIFVLFLACINYVNLTIGSLISRVKEISIRRIIGADKKQLVFQLVTESVLFAFLASIVAIIITYLFLGLFNNITGKQIEFKFTDADFLGVIILLTLFTGFISGLLPGLKFASVVANDLLKNKLSSSSDIGSFRKGLVIFQLVITIFFLISSIVINRQSKLITSFNSGFNKDNIYYVRLNEDISGKIPELRQILLQNPQILNIASASVLPNRIVTGSYFKWGISEVSDKRICEARVDYDFLKIFDMKLLAGRFFDTEHPSDAEKSILISETAYNMLQEKNAIDKPFHYGNKTYNLIGVVKNYQHNSVLSQTPGAISYLLSPNSNSYLFIKINPGLTDLVAKDQTIRYIHKICDSFSPNRPLFYSFLNDVSYNIETQFETRKELIFLATLLTILISIIGLFGLVYQSVKYRVKEIGIRKINGARVSEVMLMLNRGFIAWIAIAFMIATPIAWFAMHKLLNNFANKIRLDWWIFALAGLMAFVITILTVSWQSWKAASRNPVEVLRYE